MQTPTNKIKKAIFTLMVSVGLLSLLTLAVPKFALAADPCNQKKPTNDSLQKCLQKNPIVDDIQRVVNFLAAGVGIVIVGNIIFGGIQYSWAGNNPSAVTAAKTRIQNSLIALLAFFFVYAFLQWVIPGGTPLIKL
jgi:hypothetical protein